MSSSLSLSHTHTLSVSVYVCMCFFFVFADVLHFCDIHFYFSYEDMPKCMLPIPRATPKQCCHEELPFPFQDLAQENDSNNAVLGA